MTKLLSGRVKKVGSANVSSTRYSFIQLSETEPDLGLPAANGYVLSGNTNGQRLWIQPLTAADVLTVVQQNTPNLRSSSINELSDVDTAALAPTIGQVLTWDGANWVPNVVSVSATQLANIANTVIGVVSASISANAALFANVAGQVLTLSNFTTSNLAEGSNLYFTNTRSRLAISAYDSTIIYDTANGTIKVGNISSIVSAVVGSSTNTTLTTANVAENAASGNLYYTNARVIAGISNSTISNLTVSGNVVAGNIITGGGSGGSITGANLISANYINANVWQGLYTANVIESASNLYYTNARVYANVAPLLATKANVTDLTTANVVESTNNLYYTNARVYANVIALLPTLAGNNISIAANGQISANLSGIGASISSVTGNLTVTGNLIVNDVVKATSFIAGTGFGGNITGANLISANYINANVWQGLYTANVIESTNNLYYTNARVYANVGGLIAAKANIVDLTTANVIESASNLYYTNTRSRAALSGGVGISYSPLTGIISTNQDVSATGSVTFANLTVTGQTHFYGNVTTHNSNNLSVSDNMIYLNSGSESSNPDLGFAGNYNDGVYHHAGFFRDASDSGTWKVFENYTPEPDANIFIDTSHASFRLANLSGTTFFGNVQGTVSTLSNFTTSNLVEGTSLYYTNARVRSNVIALLPTLAGDNITIAANGRISANAAGILGTISSIAGNLAVSGNINVNYGVYANSIRINGTEIVTGGETGASLTVNSITSNIWNNLYTTNVIESASGLYYTNARVSSVVIPLLTTANVVESTSNLYYTNARVRSNVIALLPTLAGDNITIAANGRISASAAGIAGSITGLNGNITVTGNLLVTNGITANSLRINGVEVVTGGESGANITVGTVTSNIWNNLYTANVQESVGRLYYTNARVYANVISLLPTLAGNNIIIAANGQISANAQGLGAAITSLTGNINIAGNLRVTNGITANSLLINGVEIVTGGESGANITVGTVTSNTWNNLYTANVRESASNLYYTNARVASNVITLMSSFAGDNIAIAANGRISANLTNISLSNIRGNISVTGNLVATGAIIGDNLQTTGIGTPTIYSDTNIVLNAQNTIASGNIVTTQAIYAGALYVNGNPVGSGGLGTSALDDLSDVVISSPIPNQVLKYDGGTNKWINAAAASSTNTLDGDVTITNGNLTVMGTVYAGGLIVNGKEIVTGGESGANITIGEITSNIWTGIYTANVKESASNLYYTNARVYSNVLALLPTLAGSGISISAGGVISSTVGGGGTVVTSADLTTANVIESASNLYYTNARVYANVIGLINGKANVVDLTTANVKESASNLYYTNARVYANVAPLLATKANVVDLTTANVIESTSALYYTNARTRSTLSAGTGIVYDPVTGIIATSQDISSSASITVANLTVTGQTNFYGNVITHTSNNLSISDNMIYLNAGSESSNPDLGFAGNYNDGVYHHAGFFRDASDAGTWKVFENYSPEPDASAFIDTAHSTFRLANLSATTFIGNVTGTVSTLSNFTTSNLSEGINLYYTNARVYANVIGLISGKANVTDLTTANITEFGNVLYYTNARVYANVIGLIGGKANVVDLTTANVKEVGSNVYYTNARVYSNTIVLLPTLAGPGISIAANGQISANSVFTGSNLAVSGNLIVANGIYANSLRINGVEVVTGGESGANITVGTVTSNIWIGIYTANVIESASNLYFTNARVYANVIGLINGKANVVDLTTANVKESASNLYYTNARVYSNVLALLPTLAGTGISIAANGVISSTSSSSNLFANLWVTGNVNAGNVIANAFISTGAGSGSISATGDFAINSTGNIILNANSVVANNFVSTGTGSSFITSNGNFVITSTGNITLTANTVLTSNINAGNITAASVTTPSITANVWNGIYTGNLIESGNVNTGTVFFSNTRARAAFIAGGNITIDANGVISSSAGLSNAISNVTSNLIVTGNITAGNVISNAFISTGTGTGSITSTGDFAINAAGNIILNANSVVANNFVSTGTGSSFITSTANLSITAPNVIFTTSNFIVAGNIIAANFIGNVSASITNLNNFTTSNLAEGSNLYYTNARVRSTLSAGDGTIIYDPVAGTIRAASNVSASITQSLANVTTANVAENAASGNLYYTNARVRSTLSSGTGVNYSNTSGVISIGQNVSTTANVTFAQLNVTGVTNFYGNVITHSSNNLSIADNMIYLNSDSTSSNPDLGFAGNYNDGTYRHAGFFRDASDAGTWKVFENYSPEPDASIFIDTANTTFRLANIAATTFIGNVQGTVSTLSNFSTSNLREGSNLYYTNARVTDIITNSLLSNLSLAGNLYVGNILTTSNIVFGGGAGGSITNANLISATYIQANTFIGQGVGLPVLTSDSDFTISAFGNIILQGYNVTANLLTPNIINVNSITSNIWNKLYTGNIIESGNANTGNIFFSNARARAAFIAGGNITIDVNGVISASGSGTVGIDKLTTANVLELPGNLYYTNARVYANVGALITAKANIVDLTTANILESSGNIYYNNTRVYANVIELLPTLAGFGIAISANGQISSSPGAGGAQANVNISFQQFSGDGATTQFYLNRAIYNETNAIVSVDGLSLTPTVDYTIVTNLLTIPYAPPLQSNVVVRYLDITGISAASGLVGATTGASHAMFTLPDSITGDTTLASGKNALSVGPITIVAGITVSIPTGQRWVIL